MKNISLILILITGILAVSQGCSGKEMNAENAGRDSGETAVTEDTLYFTLEEVGQHNEEGDCWMVIDGKVYDVSEFVSAHPGGKAILQGCGKDATELFETRPMGSGTPHSQRARDLLKKYYMGELKE